MKCPNCGFESEGRFCLICGCQMSNEPQAQPSFEYPNTPDNTQANRTPADNAQAPNNPYAAQNIPESGAERFAPNANQPHPFPPVENRNMNGNMNGNMPYGMPVPPYAPPQNNKSGKKALKIVLLSIMAIVIVAGISIAVYSAFSYDESILSLLMRGNNNTTNNGYLENETYFEDPNIHKKGDTVELLNHNITLIDYKTGELNFDSSHADNAKLDVTFEVENTTDSDYLLSLYQFMGFNADDRNDDYSYCEAYAIDDYAGTTEIEIAAGETKKFTVNFEITRDIDAVEIYCIDDRVHVNIDDSIYENEHTESPESKYTACTYFINLAGESAKDSN